MSKLITRGASRAAMERFCAVADPSKLSTQHWSDMRFPFEGFLRFVQLPEATQKANLAKTQAAVRAHLDS